MRLRYTSGALAAAAGLAVVLGTTTASAAPAPAATSGDILYMTAPTASHVYPRIYAISPDGTGKHLLYSLGTEDMAFSAARDNGELLYLKSTGNGDPATLIERYPDGTVAHTIRFYPPGKFSLITTGPGNIALSGDGTQAALIGQSPNDNDESLFVIQTATGHVVDEPIKATAAGQRELTAVSWGPAAGELTVLDENPATGKFETQVIRLDGSVVRTYPSPDNENGYFGVAASPARILYTGSSFQGTTYNELWRQPVAGGQPVLVKSSTSPDASPVIDEPWSPDYTEYAYGTGSGSIYLAPASGGPRQRLAHADGYYPMWVSGLSSPG